MVAAVDVFCVMTHVYVLFSQRLLDVDFGTSIFGVSSGGDVLSNVVDVMYGKLKWTFQS
jgi:hypothetical protein